MNLLLILREKPERFEDRLCVGEARVIAFLVILLMRAFLAFPRNDLEACDGNRARSLHLRKLSVTLIFLERSGGKIFQRK